MALRVTKVNQCLEKRLKIAGFEVPDLLVIFFVFTMLNFFTGRFDHRLLTVWCPGVVMSATLWISKRGKPENYLIHFAKFHLKPRHLDAFVDGGAADRKLLVSFKKLQAGRIS